MDAELKQLSTYIKESDPLLEAIKAEAERYGVSVSTVIRWALAEYFKQQATQDEAPPRDAGARG